MYYLQSLLKDDIRHMNMSASAINMSTPATSANMGVDLKPAGETSPKPKPCCVCKDEKAARDECMLFSTAKDPQVACASMVEKYKTCMAGFGFNLP
ncbi:28f3fca1-90e2-4cc2-8cfc-0479f5d4d5c4 [Sclerotinia trifoliorum]|uniref:28f3fca1-90e2-4cc2-8cfc-0479f5d4d5c4 n=1 Tax=Sclerotinia trifoliorum TaxID=28548 RepID=A0A8H2VSA6_9HELO|nr:28f3fca1-90e2-4cc2-8cfc-0479f5d4d5c4 [Sclerotinia trifoliorum]